MVLTSFRQRHLVQLGGSEVQRFKRRESFTRDDLGILGLTLVERKSGARLDGCQGEEERSEDCGGKHLG